VGGIRGYVLASCLAVMSTMAWTEGVWGLASAAPPDTTLPSTVWIATDAVPMSAGQHWPALAGVAQRFYGEAFAIQALCHVAPAADEFAGAEGAYARVQRQSGNWSLQQQILHFPGDPWQAGQVAASAYASLVDTLNDCATTEPDAHVTITTPDSHCVDVIGGCTAVAATIDVPSQRIVSHVYLSSAGSSVSELSVWSSPTPSPPWAGAGDAGVLEAMNAPLCAVWPC
jgi:hypothetical protein